jgi:hypothetical protein
LSFLEIAQNRISCKYKYAINNGIQLILLKMSHHTTHSLTKTTKLFWLLCIAHSITLVTRILKINQLLPSLEIMSLALTSSASAIIIPINSQLENKMDSPAMPHAQ